MFATGIRAREQEEMFFGIVATTFAEFEANRVRMHSRPVPPRRAIGRTHEDPVFVPGYRQSAAGPLDS